MREFYTYLATVGCFVCLNDVLQLPNFLLSQNTALVTDFDVELALEIRLSKSVLFVIKKLQKFRLRESKLLRISFSIFVYLFEL